MTKQGQPAYRIRCNARAPALPTTRSHAKEIICRSLLVSVRCVQRLDHSFQIKPQGCEIANNLRVPLPPRRRDPWFQPHCCCPPRRPRRAPRGGGSRGSGGGGVGGGRGDTAYVHEAFKAGGLELPKYLGSQGCQGGGREQGGGGEEREGRTAGWKKCGVRCGEGRRAGERCSCLPAPSNQPPPLRHAAIDCLLSPFPHSSIIWARGGGVHGQRDCRWREKVRSDSRPGQPLPPPRSSSRRPRPSPSPAGLARPPPAACLVARGWRPLFQGGVPDGEAGQNPASSAGYSSGGMTWGRRMGGGGA